MIRRALEGTQTTRDVRELLSAICGLIAGQDNVNGQRVVQPHDVSFAKIVLWCMANRNERCYVCGHSDVQDGVVLHGETCPARMAQ